MLSLYFICARMVGTGKHYRLWQKESQIEQRLPEIKRIEPKSRRWSKLGNKAIGFYFVTLGNVGYTTNTINE